MSTGVSIYTTANDVPRFDGESLVLDEVTRLYPPIGNRDRAAWCRAFAAVLTTEAERADERYEEGQRCIAEMNALVERIRAEQAETAATPDADAAGASEGGERG